MAEAPAQLVSTTDKWRDVGTKSTKEVSLESESEIELKERLPSVLAHAELIKRQVADKIQREGKKSWFCPIEDRSERKEFKSKAACTRHINKNLKVRVEQAKIEGKPWEPQVRIIDPPLTIQDLTTPEQGRIITAAQQAQQDLGPILRQAKQGSRSSGLFAQSLISQPEQLAKKKVKSLNDIELTKLARLCWSRGKKVLLRTCRQECTSRQISLGF